jgi:glutathione S-transferase
MQAELLIGNRNYSSWSLRPWLALRWAGIDFQDRLVDLDQPGYGESKIAEILAVTPTGKVPALRLGALVIWDSLAIAEWAGENTRGAPLLPSDSGLRAQVRSVLCEMHAGFAAVRRDLSMNIRRRCQAYDLPVDTLADIARLDQLFSTARRKHADDGDFLFGQRTLADAFFTPVATRFRTYGISVSPLAQAYCAQLLADADFQAWEALALQEPNVTFSRANIDGLFSNPPTA